MLEYRPLVKDTNAFDTPGSVFNGDLKIEMHSTCDVYTIRFVDILAIFCVIICLKLYKALYACFCLGLEKNIVLGTKLLVVRAQLLFLINCSGIFWNLYLKFEIIAFLLQISQYLAMLTQKCNKSCLSYLIFKHIETNSFILKAVSLDWILITVAVLVFSLQFWYKRLLSNIILFRIISYQFLIFFRQSLYEKNMSIKRTRFFFSKLQSLKIVQFYSPSVVFACAVYFEE